MGRPKRIKFFNEEIYYHIMSKTSGGYFLLRKEKNKEKFLEILFHLLKGFCFKLEAFVVMNNHFHILIKSLKVDKLSDEEILRKATSAKIFKKWVMLKNTEILRKKLCDISEFTKMLKEKFSKWFNKKYNRTGYFWGGRFKSVILEDGEAVEMCKKYIEMNPVKAGITEKANSYKFSSAYKNEENFDKLEMTFDEKLWDHGIIIGSENFLLKLHNKYGTKYKLKNRKNYARMGTKIKSLINSRKSYRT